LRTRIAILVGVVALGALLLGPKLLRQSFVVKSYFADAKNLHAGARVRLAGVDIGVVKAVRARPEVKESPAEVVLLLNPGYELRIPDDSIVEIETAGVLGETFVEIDVSGTSGAPIATTGVLKSSPTIQLTAGQAIEKLGEAIKTRCDCNQQNGSSAAVGSKSKSPPSKP
jgi:ABC-type transporter Mla subunit MlaD